MSAPETIDLLAARYGKRYQWWIAMTTLCGMFSAVITTTTVNVAIPDIMGAFGIGQDHAHWFSSGALAGTSVAMLMQAWVLARFGPRNTFVAANCIFVMSLLVAGSAPNEWVLIVARVVQGMIAGTLQPLTVYMLFRVFPADRKGQAMGMFGLVAIAGPALGPSVGGVVMEFFNWRYIFFIALPMSVTAIFLGTVFLPQREVRKDAPAQKPFDWFALGLVATAIWCLLHALSTSPKEGWDSDGNLLSLGLAVVTGVWFILRELRTDAPLVDLRPLAIPRFAATTTVSCIFGVGLFGTGYLLSLFVQTVQGYSPIGAGQLLLVPGLVLGAAMPVCGYLADRLPASSLIVAGILCSVISAFWMSGADVNTPFWTLVFWISIGRIGMGLVNPALNVSGLSSLPPRFLSQGAGLVSFARQLGGAFGVNLLALTLDRQTSWQSDALAVAQSGSNATPELLREIGAILAQAGASAGLQAQGAVYYLGRVIEAQGYSTAFQDAYRVLGCAFLVALVPAFIIAVPRRKAPAARAE